MTTTIGGSFGALAKLHRPDGQRAADAEICRLFASGLKPRDISALLGINPAVIATALVRRSVTT